MRRHSVQLLIGCVVLAVAVGLTASGAWPASRTPACRTSQLTITIAHSFAGLGTAGANIRFANHSGRTCELHGWPTLGLRSAPPRSTYRQAGDWPASSFADVEQRGEPAVLLRPDQRADAIFEGADGQVTKPCGPAYRTLKVTPPGDRRSITIPAWISWLGHFMPSCSQIHVSPILPSAAVYEG